MFKSGCLYKNKINGKMYFCYGNHFNYTHKDVLYSISTKWFNLKDFEEVT